MGRRGATMSWMGGDLPDLRSRSGPSHRASAAAGAKSEYVPKPPTLHSQHVQVDGDACAVSHYGSLFGDISCAAAADTPKFGLEPSSGEPPSFACRKKEAREGSGCARPREEASEGAVCAEQGPWYNRSDSGRDRSGRAAGLRQAICQAYGLRTETGFAL